MLRESRNQTETEMEDIPKREHPKLRQPTLSWPTKKSDEGVEREREHNKDKEMSEREHDKAKEMSEKRQEDQSNWVKRSGEEDNERYRNFLKYCEDRRQESRLQQEMDKERKKTAERRERQRDLIRLSTEYLKQNEPKWRTRKIAECERKLTKSVGRAVIGQNIIITNPIDEITSSAQQSTSLILKRPTN